MKLKKTLDKHLSKWSVLYYGVLYSLAIINICLVLANILSNKGR